VKADEIRDYFDGWQENLARVKSLMEVPEYYREAWLVSVVAMWARLVLSDTQGCETMKSIKRPYANIQG
jgi:hypothetical protein